MSTEQLSIPMLIIAIVFALLGATLVWFGARRKKRYMYTLGTGFFVGAGVAVFVESAQIREILTAAAIVFAAFIAALSIDEARRLRKESVDKDNRDRRERLLNEIIEWATDILECVPEIIIPAAGAKSKDTMLGLTMFNLVLKYKSVDARTEYVKGIASTFGKSLESGVEITSQQLAEVIKFVLSHPPDERSYDMVGGYTEPLSTSTVAVIKTATKIKTEEISYH